MSLFGGFFGELNDDPFFGGHMRQMSQMSRMMDPFGEMLGGYGGQARHSNALMNFGFPDMNAIMNNFVAASPMSAALQGTWGHPALQQGRSGMGNGNCHSYSTSTVMRMSSGPDGEPQIYRETQSMRCAPGGIKETKKAVHDSRSGTKRMAIGHHIGERAHVKERLQNIHSGDQEESEDFINLEEEEAEDFNREWSRKARASLPSQHAALEYRERDDGRRHRQLPAITAGSPGPSRYRPRSSLYSSNSSSRRSLPALTHSTSPSTVEITEITDDADEQEPEPEPKPEKSRKRPRDSESQHKSQQKTSKHRLNN